MSLQATIDRDFTAALKHQDLEALSALRLLRAELTMTEKSRPRDGQPLSEDEVLKVIRSAVKKIQESIEEYTKGNRPDLVDKEKKDLAVMERYLPAALSDEQVAELVKAARAELPAGQRDNFGAVMGAVMKKTANTVDGNRVRDLVTQELAS